MKCMLTLSLWLSSHRGTISVNPRRLVLPPTDVITSTCSLGRLQNKCEVHRWCVPSFLLQQNYYRCTAARSSMAMFWKMKEKRKIRKNMFIVIDKLHLVDFAALFFFCNQRLYLQLRVYNILHIMICVTRWKIIMIYDTLPFLLIN